MASEANLKGHSRGAAAGDKRRREWESVQVLDGASAPKHTGRDRHDGRAAGVLRPGGASTLTNRGGGGSGRGIDLGDPAALGAVTLALGLLHSRLKAEATARGASKRASAMHRGEEAVRAMADPFVPLLTRQVEWPSCMVYMCTYTAAVEPAFKDAVGVRSFREGVLWVVKCPYFFYGSSPIGCSACMQGTFGCWKMVGKFRVFILYTAVVEPAFAIFFAAEIIRLQLYGIR